MEMEEGMFLSWGATVSGDWLSVFLKFQSGKNLAWKSLNGTGAHSRENHDIGLDVRMSTGDSSWRDHTKT